jgi:ribosomal protein S12 methylthiotransferase accessory factor
MAGLKMSGKRCTVFESYRNLGTEAVDPRQCGIYEPFVYETERNLESFSEDMKLRWVWGYSLTEHRPILVPLQFVYYGDPSADEPKLIHNNSTGSATGSCLEEAAFFALLEGIERDAFVLHWYRKLSPPQIDITSVRNPETRMSIDRLCRMNLDVYLLDVRSDIPIPSVVAVIARQDDEMGAFAIGSASNFDPEQAIASALSEVAGRQYGFRARTRFSEQKIRASLSNFRAIRTMADHAALYGLPESVKYAHFLIESSIARSVGQTYENWHLNLPNTADLLGDIEYCLTLLAGAGLRQVIVIDQTSAEQLRLGLRTVRVIVPGMLPLDFGYGHCRAASLPRLYSAPAQLGLGQNGAGSGDIYRVPHPFA